MDTPRTALGELVRAAREAAGHRSRATFASVAGVSERSVASIERGEPVGGRVQRAIERGLGWPQGSVSTFLETGDDSALKTKSTSPDPDPVAAAEEFRSKLRSDFEDLMSRVDEFIEQERRRTM